MKKAMVILGLLALALSSGAQEQLSVKQQADKLFDRYEYSKSLGLYLEISAKNNLAINERIADCYREMNDYKNAEEWYAKVVDQPKVAKIDHYFYAEALLRNRKFSEAKEQYKLYYTDDAAELSLKLADCDSAALWMQHPANYILKNTILNSQYSDWGLVFDGKLGFIFVSDKVTNDAGTDNRTGNNWFKLYHANINQDEVSELPIINQSNIKVDGQYHIGPMSVNAAADSAYITVTTEVAAKNIPLDRPDKRSSQRLYTRRLELLMARKVNGQWVIYGGFPYNNIQQYSVGEAALSKDGRILYFSSDMPGGEGKIDIWYCEKRGDGTWGKPVNCGKTINTKDEDAFPYIDNNGTLYYASKGLPGMGGYDIYMAKGEKANWSTPQNLKYPVNTTADDFSMVTRDGVTGYLSSNRDEGKGSDDIYAFAQDTTRHPKFRITPNISPAQHPTPHKLVLSNIYFDLDKSNIRPDAAEELDKMAILLKQHPILRIEISGYTDTRASSDYNVGLSQRRAEAAKDYLVSKGISTDRFTVKWHGKTHLANQCADGVNCTEADHQLNRRVEFKVLNN
jgi:outer membrane protein OmpA-like peptidoglycan-associated protein